MESQMPVLYKELYIAGVGASAGGLKAITDFLTSLPPDIGNLAIVIAQHLSPTYNSRMAELLSLKTRLEVKKARNGIVVEANKIYIAPPNAHINIYQGKLLLTKGSDLTGPKPSVDDFFDSLAQEKREKAVGIILSGTGADGASGIKAIKQAGGITIAQEPQTAEHNGMPLAAIDSGCVDLVTSPSEIWHILREKTNWKWHSSNEKLPESREEIHMAYYMLPG
jgi:two-component system, chemotaxis family, CheB/CheR fusion protein